VEGIRNIFRKIVWLYVSAAMAAFYGDAWSTGKTILHDHDPRSASYWPLADYVHKPTLALLDHDPGAPPEQAWRRKLNSHVNFLTSFSLTFMELLSMVIFTSSFAPTALAFTSLELGACDQFVFSCSSAAAPSKSCVSKKNIT
jgi:hypothetical protein